MATLTEILTILRRAAPEASALPNDPIGLLIGSETDMPVTKIGVCLDATPGAVRRTIDGDATLLIAHHPLIYSPLKRLDAASDPIARAVTALVKADVALYAMHTNWDRADGGINDTLADIMGLQNVRRLGENGEACLPRIGDLPSPMTLADFLLKTETALACRGTSALRVNAGDLSQTISRVAVCGGAGASLAGAVQAAGADAYVTSDVRHHEFLDAAGRGLALLDAGHQATETPGMRALARMLTERLPEVEVLWVGDQAPLSAPNF
jgi:dinuclear metal center YbgI/SA1388 family protein